jgi:LmbE family N-acetylglucosaminyl deacetylase
LGMAKNVLVFAPHPDDAEIYTGGTVAKMIKEGAKATIVVATDGSKGSFDMAGPALAQTRKAEAQQAEQVLGAQPPVFLGYVDFELDKLAPGVLREKLIRIIRQYKPDVVFSLDPYAPYEPHPDHRALAWAGWEALNFSNLPLIHPEHSAEGLQPHFVAEKYYYAVNPNEINKIVDISATMDKKLAALNKHMSQMVFMVKDIVRQAAIAGLDLHTVIGNTIDDPVKAMNYSMRLTNGKMGQQIGVTYGEGYRYERFHPLIEDILSAQG